MIYNFIILYAKSFLLLIPTIAIVYFPLFYVSMNFEYHQETALDWMIEIIFSAIIFPMFLIAYTMQDIDLPILTNIIYFFVPLLQFFWLKFLFRQGKKVLKFIKKRKNSTS